MGRDEQQNGGISGGNAGDLIADAPNLNYFWSGLLVEELVRCGVECFCLSPGSRCAPLTATAARHPRARTIVHYDERGAAFHALGRASATGRPVALICTSGSAVANYWPAVVEASAAHAPLILITADRPPELLDCGANQAIDQRDIFGRYVRWSVQLPCPEPPIDPHMLLSTADQAVYRALRAPAGPVHINCMFREPLAPSPCDRDAVVAGVNLVTDWLAGTEAYTTWPVPKIAVNGAEQAWLINRFNNVAQGVLVVGRLRHPGESAAVAMLAGALEWPVFPDIASGLRLRTGPRCVHHYDQLLLSEAFREECRPELVLHLGGAVTSKRLGEHWADLRPEYLHVAEHPLRHDPGHLVSRRWEADIIEFCQWLAPAVRHRGAKPWGEHWLAASQKVSETVDAWMAGMDTLSEIGVARILSRLCPENHVLFLGNSMPIRDMDMYAATDGAGPRVAVNRGASGIDGHIATASGCAAALQQPVTALIGDLALFHDINSLSLLRAAGAPVILVVINNDGGGIFSFLPIAAASDVFERAFAAPHGLRFEDAARLFDLHYACPESPAALESAYSNALRLGQSMLIEVSTRRDENFRQHLELQQCIRDAVKWTMA